MASGNRCPTSAKSPRINLPIPGTAYGDFVKTPTLKVKSPLLHHGGPKSSRVFPRNSESCGLLQVPQMFGNNSSRHSPSSPRNIQDRLIPCRSQTDIKLAQHLLSPLSAPQRTGATGEPADDCSNVSTVTRILNFGTSPKIMGTNKQTHKPLSVVTHSSHSKSGKVKIPTKPDRVMAAPGTFLDCGFQSAHWAPSTNLVVALESGVYVCKINEDCHVVEIRSNSLEPENPFCHVIWNTDGNAVICGKMSGEVKICDLRHPILRRSEYDLITKNPLRCFALEQEHLLTCGGSGVKIYDLRQLGSSRQEPMLSLKSRSTTVNSLSWSSNGHLLAGGCESGMTYLWDVRHPSKEMVSLRQQEKNPVQVVSWCTWKPSILLTGSSFPHPSICIQNTATGVMLGQVDCASEVTGIQFNCQLKQVATSHHSIVQDVSGTPISTSAAHGTDSSVQLWQLSSHKLTPMMELGQHEEGIIALASSVNSHQLLTMGGDELLCLWHWSETVQENCYKAGSLTARSLLNPTNFIR